MISKKTIQKIEELYDEGYSKSYIAKTLNISRPSIDKYLDLKGTEINKRKINPTALENNFNAQYQDIDSSNDLIKLQQEFEEDQWVNYYSEIANNHLKNITPNEYMDLLNVRHFLNLKSEARKSLIPHIGNESKSTITDLAKLVAQEFYNKQLKHIVDNTIKDKKRKDLIESGVDKVKWKVISMRFNPEYDLDLDTNEKSELEEFVKKRLEINIKGTESESELDKIVDYLIDKWLDLY